MVKTMVRQAVPLQPMENDGGADIHLQPMENPTPEQVDAPKGGCDPMGSPCWSKFLAGPVDPWREEPTPEQIEALLVSPEFKQPTLFVNKDLMHNNTSEMSGVALHKL
ncbi:AN1-type zinc finger protein 5-like [Grus japonensis]|uniref:AN1-type zinc finger protein 5-like n=1 Tax=Grus japonensis TaxID=30415 RepID=A0ABC9Y923_GRUJA